MSDDDAATRITRRIEELGDWRGATLARMRKLIHDAVPTIEETWKWMGTPVFEHDGVVCTGESYQAVVKLTFARGASLPDPKKLFNSSIDGNVRRAIDIRAGESIDATAFKQLVRAAVAANADVVAARAAKKVAGKATTKTPAKKTPAKKTPAKKTPAKKAPAKKAVAKKIAKKKA